MTRHRLTLFAAMLAVFTLLGGCAGTRTLPESEPVPGKIGIPPSLAQQGIALSFDPVGTVVDGMHHDGLLQVPQPWNFGPSDAQKHKLYANLVTLTMLSIRQELQRQGLRIDTGKELGAGMINLKKNQLLLACKLTNITLNTYGEYAGDYWDATLDIQVQLTRLKDGKKLFDETLHEYAKLKPSPIMADFMKTMIKVIPDTLAGNQMEVLTKDYSDVYNMKDYILSPAEVAGRYAARDIVKKLVQTDTR